MMQVFQVNASKKWFDENYIEEYKPKTESKIPWYTRTIEPENYGITLFECEYTYEDLPLGISFIYVEKKEHLKEIFDYWESCSKNHCRHSKIIIKNICERNC